MVVSLAVDVHVPEPAAGGMADQTDVGAELASLSERLAANEALLDQEVAALTQKVEGIAAIVESLACLLIQPCLSSHPSMCCVPFQVAK